jgi:hypothetical protein
MAITQGPLQRPAPSRISPAATPVRLWASGPIAGSRENRLAIASGCRLWAHPNAVENSRQTGAVLCTQLAAAWGGV